MDQGASPSKLAETALPLPRTRQTKQKGISKQIEQPVGFALAGNFFL
ncbi:MAG: hypothetical protein NTZ56_02735 [Acidobacteria bacterium]|nr:hypothetical protein [Acidobacteriota bacterium]